MIYFDGFDFDTNLQYDFYILDKYLTKHYDNETSLQLLNANSGNLDVLAMALGEKDVEFFCLYFMSDIFVVKDTNVARQLAKGHYELWEIANNIFIKDKYDKVAIIEPRGKNLNAMPRSYRNIA